MNPKCRTCYTELAPGTSFCRQCGSAINNEVERGSEEPTAVLRGSDTVATQRLDARATGDRGCEGVSQSVAALPDPNSAKKKSVQRSIISAVIAMIAVFCVLCAALVFAFRGSGRMSSNVAPVYPGSKTLVDMKYGDGSRALTLETADSLSKVEGWYQSNLKPSKVIRLTSGSVVLKNQNTTATLVVENDKTNILIKMTP